MPDKLQQECHTLISQSRVLLQDLHDWGYDTITAPQVSAVVGPHSETVAAEKPQITTLDQLRTQLLQPQTCPLDEQVRLTAFGRGNAGAQVVVVGTMTEQQGGLPDFPYCGQEGRLLVKILHSIGLTPDDIYICHLIKCQAPHNRNAQGDEVDLSAGYLRQMLTLIQPRLIIALGAATVQTLLQKREAIAPLRGQWQNYAGIDLMPTFDASWLLNNPAAKRDLWEDLKRVLVKLRES